VHAFQEQVILLGGTRADLAPPSIFPMGGGEGGREEQGRSPWNVCIKGLEKRSRERGITRRRRRVGVFFSLHHVRMR